MKKHRATQENIEKEQSARIVQMDMLHLQGKTARYVLQELKVSKLCFSIILILGIKAYPPTALIIAALRSSFI